MNYTNHCMPPGNHCTPPGTEVRLTDLDLHGLLVKNEAPTDHQENFQLCVDISNLDVHGETGAVPDHHQENFQVCVDLSNLHVHRDAVQTADYHQENFQLCVDISDLDLHEPQDHQKYEMQWPKVRADKIFVAEGGFSIFNEYDFVDISADYQGVRYDLTHTLQIKRPASTLNTLIGVQKDAQGNLVGTNSNYNPSTNTFIVDDVTLTSSDFLANLQATDISDLGIFEQQYTNFINGINRYFGIRGVDDQLVSQSIDGDRNGFLSIPEFHTLITTLDSTNNYLLTGTITINHLNKQLKNITSVDLFENRNDRGIEYGFFPGDKILLKNGLKVTYTLDIGPANYPVPAGEPSAQYDQPYYDDSSINTVPNLAKAVVGDILFILT